MVHIWFLNEVYDLVFFLLSYYIGDCLFCLVICWSLLGPNFGYTDALSSLVSICLVNSLLWRPLWIYRVLFCIRLVLGCTSFLWNLINFKSPISLSYSRSSQVHILLEVFPLCWDCLHWFSLVSIVKNLVILSYLCGFYLACSSMIIVGTHSRMSFGELHWSSLLANLNLDSRSVNL